jgi:hypothetical protein
VREAVGIVESEGSFARKYEASTFGKAGLGQGILRCEPPVFFVTNALYCIFKKLLSHHESRLESRYLFPNNFVNRLLLLTEFFVRVAHGVNNCVARRHKQVINPAHAKPPSVSCRSANQTSHHVLTLTVPWT